MLSDNLTPTTDDGRRTTDNSALEKLRCHSAGGAKTARYLFFDAHSFSIVTKPDDDVNITEMLKTYYNSLFSDKSHKFV